MAVNSASTTHWAQLVSGNREAFRLIYERYVDRLFEWGQEYDGDPDLVKDAIQEVFVNLFIYRDKLSRDVNIGGYLRVCLRREIVRLRKKHLSLMAVRTDYPLPTEEPDAEQRYIDAEIERNVSERLSRELTALPLRQREALQLRYIDELSYDDVSRIMNLPVPTCRTLLFRAVRRLRLRMGNGAISLLAVLLSYGNDVFF